MRLLPKGAETDKVEILNTDTLGRVWTPRAKREELEEKVGKAQVGEVGLLAMFALPTGLPLIAIYTIFVCVWLAKNARRRNRERRRDFELRSVLLASSRGGILHFLELHLKEVLRRMQAPAAENQCLSRACHAVNHPMTATQTSGNLLLRIKGEWNWSGYAAGVFSAGTGVNVNGISTSTTKPPLGPSADRPANETLKPGYILKAWIAAVFLICSLQSIVAGDSSAQSLREMTEFVDPMNRVSDWAVADQPMAGEWMLL